MEPPWPGPSRGEAPWQDIYLCPPAHGQPVWLRRQGEDATALRAVFDRKSRVFALPRGWRIQWYEASKWTAG